MPAVPEKIWEVVLSGSNGGLPVTADEDERSAAAGQLPKGALVRELGPPTGSRHVLGRRLHYAKVSGAGPETGWVTTSRKEKDFLVRTYDVRSADLERLNTPLPAPMKALLLVPGGRQYDLVIYGASGFTGGLAAEHLDALLCERAGQKPVRWAVAGRNAERLTTLARRCKTAPSVVLAATEEELSALAACCRVLLSAAGPYQLSGEAVVKACVQQGTHYVDVTGEATWVHDMIERYHEEARRKGVMIVHFAAQVCAIDDISCYLLAKLLGPLRQFREYFWQFGGMTGGTFCTSIETMERMTPEVHEVFCDPFNLGGHRKCGVRDTDKDCSMAEKDHLYPNVWLHPAYSSIAGSRAIRRTCQLFEETPGDGLQYGEGICVTIREAVMSQKVAEAQVQMQAMPKDAENRMRIAAAMRAQLAENQAPLPGQGPPSPTRDMYYSEVIAVAEGESGDWAHVHYMGPEAYEVTAMTCVAAALALVEEPHRLQPESRGGVLTPAFALHGSSFIQRLEAHGFANGKGRKMRFEALPGKPTEEMLQRAIKEKMKNAAMGQAQLTQGSLKRFE